MKIDYNDFQLLYKYLEQHCKGSPLSIEITPQNRLEIKSTNINQDFIIITIYQADSNGHMLAPTVSKQEKLKL